LTEARELGGCVARHREECIVSGFIDGRNYRNATVRGSGSKGNTREKYDKPSVICCGSRTRERRMYEERSKAGPAGFSLGKECLSWVIFQKRGTCEKFDDVRMWCSAAQSAENVYQMCQNKTHRVDGSSHLAFQKGRYGRW
jgi:hypothetical protein